jgi:hypothetical protein
MSPHQKHESSLSIRQQVEERTPFLLFFTTALFRYQGCHDLTTHEAPILKKKIILFYVIHHSQSLAIFMVFLCKL